MKHLASVSVGIVCLAVMAPSFAAQTQLQSSAPIPAAQLGAKAGAQYQGDGLSVRATPAGARLRCVFQKMEGRVWGEGLVLDSTVEPRESMAFCVVARTVGRLGAQAALPR